MKFIIDEKERIAEVWCSNADQKDKKTQKKLNEIIENCHKKKIFVCVYESGNDDVVENTKDLLQYNLNGVKKKSVGKNAVKHRGMTI